MPRITLRESSLVLYKNRPARVNRVSAKVEIELETGETLKVRLKDIQCLHPGPVHNLADLQPQDGEIETAWEILAGDTVSFVDLVELVYGTYTPATAWAAWQLVADGLYFHGTPDRIMARLPEEVVQEKAVREARAAERKAWAAFIERAGNKRIAPQDSRYLQEVEALALRKKQRSRVLRELGRSERPQTAHALLLELGYWEHTVNPYPERFGLEVSPPQMPLPKLPEEERVDLTHLPAFAVDDEGSQDPDDALSLEGDRLWVHVADVAALVCPGSALDLEARARGATLYLPEATVPMLPPGAAQALGLGLNEVSPALSFGLDLTSEGGVARLEIAPSWVRVTRMTYEDAEVRLDEEPFLSLHRLAQIHEARREENGAIPIELPEVKIRVQDGMIEIRPLPLLKSRTLVAEAMLIAGAAAARFALERDIPFPFSTQEPPHWETPGWPSGLAGMYALRRALKRSQMTSVPAPHAGLGLAVYAQVTSPLRRYLDLVAHQQLRAYLCGEELLNSQELLGRVGAAEAVMGSIRQAERFARQHWTLAYLMDHQDWRGEGVLVEKHGSQGTILIPEIDLETQVHLREDLALDSVVSLVLVGVDLPGLEAHFRIER